MRAADAPSRAKLTQSPWEALAFFCGIGAVAGTWLTYAVGPSWIYFTLAALGIAASIVYARRRGFSLPMCAVLVVAAVGATFVLTVAAMLAWLTTMGIVAALQD